MMTIKYGLQFLFFELTDNDGQNFVAGIVHVFVLKKVSAQICNFFQFLSLFLLQFAAALFSRANKTTPVRFENV
jgi:hypothetical protein